MRASVVLPVPGGPQRIRERSWSFSMLTRNGLPGASKMLLSGVVLQSLRTHPICQRRTFVRSFLLWGFEV